VTTEILPAPQEALEPVNATPTDSGAAAQPPHSESAVSIGELVSQTQRALSPDGSALTSPRSNEADGRSAATEAESLPAADPAPTPADRPADVDGPDGDAVEGAAVFSAIASAGDAGSAADDDGAAGNPAAEAPSSDQTVAKAPPSPVAVSGSVPAAINTGAEHKPASPHAAEASPGASSSSGQVSPLAVASGESVSDSYEAAPVPLDDLVSSATAKGSSSTGTSVTNEAVDNAAADVTDTPTLSPKEVDDLEVSAPVDEPLPLVEGLVDPSDSPPAAPADASLSELPNASPSA